MNIFYSRNLRVPNGHTPVMGEADCRGLPRKIEGGVAISNLYNFIL